MTERYNRREFLKRLLALSATGALAGLSGCGGQQPAPAQPSATAALEATPAGQEAAPKPAATAVAQAEATETAPAVVPATAKPAAPIATGNAYLAVARGADADPAELTRRAIAAIGGIERFVKKGDDVIVKPNICNAYYGPEYASTTNPQVIAAIIALCLGAGARRVRVMDYPFGGTPQAAYAKSGIADAVKAAGGEMEVMSSMKFREVEFPQGKRIKKWQVYGDVLDANVVINVPIPKDHGSTLLTLGMKNLMGVIEDRNGFHARGLHQCIADLNTVVRPQLIVVDAIRILMNNGPTGGNLNDVKKMDRVIAGTDVVAADAYACTLFGLKGSDIEYIVYGAEMGLGTMDLGAIKIEEIAV